MIELVMLEVKSDELLDEVFEDGPGLGCISPEHIISIYSHVEDKIVKKPIVRLTEKIDICCKTFTGYYCLI